MCGIAGIVNKDGNAVNENSIHRMCDLIAHRGPDGEGYYFDENIGFGHRRLAILDLTDQGAQPMESKCGEYVVTYNGEIYNYIELRNELIDLDYRFETDCDTEVLLAAYEEWGDSCVERFNGMWAFAIHDKKRNMIFCSRDRFGIKPFYYIDMIEKFSFSSEIRQLLDFLPRCEANEKVLLDFVFANDADSTEQTFFENVTKLMPGHNLYFCLESHNINIQKYYTISLREDISQQSSEEAVQTYKEALESSVLLRLRSDVPVGTCLSGGLDSSSIALIAANHYQHDNSFAAITAVSEQKDNDESEYARIVAETGSMNWIKVKPTYKDFVETLDDVVYAQEEPFGGPSIVMQYHVMKTAKEHGLTVMLDGQGGDETLLGYEKYYPAYYADIFRNKGVIATIKAVRESKNNNDNMSLSWVIKYTLGGLLASVRYLHGRYKHRYLKVYPKLPRRFSSFSSASLNLFRLQSLELSETSLPILLRHEDKNSMAHSIESRLPFIDYNVVEIALSLPVDTKIREGWTKWVLRQGMVGVMPDSVAWRKNKLGFEAPDRLWMKQHQEEIIQKVFHSPLIDSIVDIKTLKNSFPKLDRTTQWRLYSIALWEERFGVIIKS